MLPDIFVQFANSSIVLFLVKAIILFTLALYLVFGLVMLRQVQLMTRTLSGNLNILMFFTALAHLLAALGLFVFAFLTL